MIRPSAEWLGKFAGGASEAAASLLRALESWPFGFTVTDTTLDEPGPTILHANEAFAAMVGLPLDRILGRSPRFLQGRDTSRDVLARLRRALSEEKTFFGETVNYRADGSPFVMQWSVAPLYDAAGALVCFCALQRDVTEERRLESFVASRNLSETLDTMTASLVHQLASPLASVSAALELLSADPSLSVSTATIARAALREAEAVGALVRNTRSLNALSATSSTIFDARAEVEQAVALVQGRARTGHVRVQASVPDSPVYVSADARLVFQCLLNLLQNAVDACSGAPTWAGFREVPPLVSLAVRAEGASAVRFSVTDNGPGIAADDLARVWAPLYSTKSTGSGLGLAIVRTHVTRMGGTVSLQSERDEERGAATTTVAFVLPGAARRTEPGDHAGHHERAR